jgi:riboflavin synthase
MFTGIVEQLGLVAGLVRGSKLTKLAVSAAKIFDEAKVGDSISVNGVCLTITATRRNFAEFDLSLETLKTSTLGELRIGDRVNLERALSLNGRLGGHLVTGHVDGVGEIKNYVAQAESLELFLSIPSELLRYIVPKGPIAIDGVSLTVSDFRDGLLSVSIIPHTAKNTTLGFKKVGDKVNIEVDILSKYVERHLRREEKPLVGEETLVRMGFLPLGWMDN